MAVFQQSSPSYRSVAGREGGILQHVQAGGAVSHRAVEITAAAMADVTCSVGNLPTVNENCRVLTHTQCGAIGQNQVVCQVAITETLREFSRNTKTLLQTKQMSVCNQWMMMNNKRQAKVSLTLMFSKLHYFKASGNMLYLYYKIYKSSANNWKQYNVNKKKNILTFKNMNWDHRNITYFKYCVTCLTRKDLQNCCIPSVSDGLMCVTFSRTLKNHYCTLCWLQCYQGEEAGLLIKRI